MPEMTLLRRESPLSLPAEQRRILDDGSAIPSFDSVLVEHRCQPLRASKIEVLQINVGKLCNQTCAHCHVDAGPDRREIMSRQTMEECLAVLRQTPIETVDVTGGAPEMNPHFRWLVGQCRELGRRVIDRCNLTILLAPGYDDLSHFLADHQVEIIASLPCYLEENTDRQRGKGVFARSLEALRRLNAVGYGRAGTELPLTLVFNPQGLSLPPDQAELERAYHRELEARYGVVFNRLFTITNMPISRFLDDLLRRGRYEEYMLRLVDAFNPATVEGLMCRTTLSVDWQGYLYDCDFNQMLELGLSPKAPQHIREFDLEALQGRLVATGRHCFGCTAGAGSSCQGSLAKQAG
jgi:radical SAM/Cys-rich protein